MSSYIDWTYNDVLFMDAKDFPNAFAAEIPNAHVEITAIRVSVILPAGLSSFNRDLTTPVCGTLPVQKGTTRWDK